MYAPTPILAEAQYNRFLKINNAMASVSPAVAPARWFKEIKKGSTTP